MAKRTKSKQSLRSVTPQRAYHYNTNRRLLRARINNPLRHPDHLYAKPLRSMKRLRRLAPYVAASVALSGADRRQFHPGRVIARKWNGVPTHRLALPRVPAKKWGTPGSGKPAAALSRVLADNPQNLVECIKRQTRAEIMHALGHVGKRQRPREMGPFSGVKC